MGPNPKGTFNINAFIYFPSLFGSLKFNHRSMRSQFIFLLHGLSCLFSQQTLFEKVFFFNFRSAEVFYHDLGSKHETASLLTVKSAMMRMIIWPFATFFYTPKLQSSMIFLGYWPISKRKINCWLTEIPTSYQLLFKTARGFLFNRRNLIVGNALQKRVCDKTSCNPIFFRDAKIPPRKWEVAK